MSGYIGNIPVPQATQTRQSFTATASQTTFNTAGYSVGYVDVFLNGVKLAPADYTATNGSDIILAVGAASGDILEIVAYEIFQVVDQDFTGDFTVDGTTFVVDSTNDRVGIGTSSPTADGLHIYNATQPDLFMGTSTDADGFRITYNDTDTILGNYSSTPLRIVTGGSERMRIDSSGHLLVGTTAQEPAASNDDSGFSVRPVGTASISRTSGPTLDLNRKTSDGDIVNFRKDSTTVGSIGVTNGDLMIGQGSVGIRFLDSAPALYPTIVTTGSTASDSIDIGTSAARFKDLYLSGGVYLGGTGSANHLDDYEEGTWTPTIFGYTGSTTQTYSSQSGNYVKIGNFVIASFFVALSNKGDIGGSYMFIGGMPFTPASSTSGYGGISRFSGLTTSISSMNAEIGGGISRAWLTRVSGTYGTADGYLGSSEIGNSTYFAGSLMYNI